jgi:hypothetical protein
VQTVLLLQAAWRLMIWLLLLFALAGIASTTGQSAHRCNLEGKQPAEMQAKTQNSSGFNAVAEGLALEFSNSEIAEGGSAK